MSTGKCNWKKNSPFNISITIRTLIIFPRNPEPAKSSYCLSQNVAECRVKRISDRNGTMSYMNSLPRETTITGNNYKRATI